MKKVIAILVLLLIIVTPVVVHAEAFTCLAEEAEEEGMEYVDGEGVEYMDGYMGEEYLNTLLSEQGKNYEVQMRFTEDLETSEQCFEVIKGGYVIRTNKLYYFNGRYWLTKDELERIADVLIQHW